MFISVIWESVFVGFYCVFIYLLVVGFFSYTPFRIENAQSWPAFRPIKRPLMGVSNEKRCKKINLPPEVVLFLTGFIKHFMGWILQIHKLYCNYGTACINKRGDVYKTGTEIYIIPESILEGFLFVVVGLLIFGVLHCFFSPLHIKNMKMCYQWVGLDMVGIFLIGVFFHLLAEWLGIHSLFCKYRCLIH